MLNIFLISVPFASEPISVVVTGCVEKGIFKSKETDFCTHKVNHSYSIKIYDKDKNIIDLNPYNGKMIKIKGILAPGDILYADNQFIEMIGNCASQ